MSSPGTFNGRIGTTTADSTPDWEDFRRPPVGAPNFVVIVLDDTGFGQLGRFGGATDTPAMDSIGAEGVTFTNFHMTPLCSPSRASLLTGRNHHSVGMGYLAGYDTGYPSYRGRVEPNAATVARMLRDEGYSTYAVGKWHLVPPSDLGGDGPFDHWPLAKGFDRHYGFVGGEDDQFSPQLWVDNHFADPPKDQDYHLSEDLIDQSIGMISEHISAGQDRPFFLYLAFGAMHAPHQAPASYIEKYKGRFDHGWDAERARVLQRQIEHGIVPQGTELPPSADKIPAWDSLSADEKRLYARMQEVFSGFLEHTDDQVARLLAHLDANGLSEDTLVVVVSDNGASAEGGRDGTVNQFRHYMGIEDSIEENLAQLDEIGGPKTHNHYPAGWAQAGNTPMRFFKWDTYAGGVRVPCMARWPGGLAGQGTYRSDFAHAVDIVPTILEASGITPRTSYDGVEQLPIHGSSLLRRPAPSRSQYFEITGKRGLWYDGWKIVTRHSEGDEYGIHEWELYDVTTDLAEQFDLAAQHPEIVARLDREWWDAAERYSVLPLDDRTHLRALDRGPNGHRDHFVLMPGSRQFSTVAGPNWVGRSYRLATRITRAPGDDGVIISSGRRAAGFALFALNDRLRLDYNRAGLRTELESAEALPVGPFLLEWEMDVKSRWLANARFLVDGRVVMEGAVATLPGGLGQASTQVGHSAPSAVSDAYAPPFSFSGELGAISLDFADGTPAASSEADLQQQ